MSATLLWRLTGDPQAVAPEKLTAGLRNHLASDDLTSVVMQIGAVQQRYVMLPSCEGCETGGCAIGCRSSLFRRMLHSSGGNECKMLLVRVGLNQRPYTRAVLAWPTRQAQPLSGALLEPYADARLSLHWRQSLLRKRITVVALLLVGADGPAPAPALRAAGWRYVPLPEVRGRLARLLTRPLPPAWLAAFGQPFSGDPWLMGSLRNEQMPTTQEHLWNTPSQIDPSVTDETLSDAAPPVTS